MEPEAKKELSKMMGWYNGAAGGSGWIVMTLMMLGFWALVIFAVVAVFRGIGKSDGRPVEGPTRQEPQNILDARFARGEIDLDEYEMRAQVLRSATPEGQHKSAH